MSQAGLLRISDGGLPPDVPIQFTTDSGIAVPAANNLNIFGTSVAAGSTPVETTGATDTVTVEVQTSQAIAATDATKIGLSAFDSASFAVDANGFVTLSGSGIYISLSPFIVGSDVHSGYSTIATAITEAVADGASATNPKNIYIKPKSGGYTENLTLSDGINLIGFGSSSSGGAATTKITGKITMTTAGSASVSNLVLSTNADYVVEVTGSAAASLILDNCYINASNANAIHVTNTNAGITLQYCFGACSTNAFFIMTAGGINARYCFLTGINTTTNNAISGGSLVLDFTYMSCPTTTSGTGSVSIFKCEIICTNTACVTYGGGATSVAMETRFESGTATALTIGATDTVQVIHCSVQSSNANAISGTGTLKYGMIVFYGTSSTVNTSTQTALATMI